MIILSKLIFIVLSILILTSCEKEQTIGGVYPIQHDASVVFIFENEDGENLLNPTSSETLIPENPTFEGNIYVKTHDDTYRAYWSEFYDPDFKYNEKIELKPTLYIRNLKNIEFSWEQWDPSLFDDQDYAVCLHYGFRDWAPTDIEIVNKSYTIYIDGTDISHTFTFTCQNKLYNDNADMEAHCKYLLDGVEPGEQPFRIVVKSKS